MNSEMEIARLRREHDFDVNQLLVSNAGSLSEVDSSVHSSSAFSDATQGEIANSVESSWWYETRNEIIVRKLRKCGFLGTLWDIGSGTGVVTSAIVAGGMPSMAVEPSKGGAILAAARQLPSIHGTLEGLKLPDSCITEIGAFDVLEHIENRDRFLEEIFRVLRPGGRFILTVPALSLLWSQADVDARHFLRYSRRTLRKELESHGFEVDSNGYFFGLTVLPLLLIRSIPFRLHIRSRISDDSTLRANGGLIGRLARSIEVAVAGYLPFGSSLLAVARKPD